MDARKSPRSNSNTRRVPKPGKKIRVGKYTFTLAQVLVASLLSGLILTGLYVSRTEKITLSVSISAPYGGVFENPNECQPKADYSEAFSSLRVISSTGKEVELPYEMWSSVSVNNCQKILTLSLSPNDSYTVLLGANEVGSIVSADFERGQKSFSKEILVTRSLSGVNLITQRALYCTATDCFWYASDATSRRFTTSGNVGSSCSGINSSYDIYDGALVTLYDSTGKVLGTTSLSGSIWVIDKDLSTARSFCKMEWKLDNIPNDDAGYSVEIGRRSKIFVSLEQLLENDLTFYTGNILQ